MHNVALRLNILWLAPSSISVDGGKACAAHDALRQSLRMHIMHA